MSRRVTSDAPVADPIDAPVGGARRWWAARSFVGDGSVVVLAAAVVLGALRPVAVPVVLPIALAAGAALLRRPVLVVLVAPLLAGALAHQAIDGAAPAARGRIDTTATLVSDPDDSFGAVQAVARADGRRYRLRARGSSAGQLRRALAGEVVSIAGRIEPRRPEESWLLVEHVVGHIDVERVALIGRGDPVSRAANAYRRLLDRGAEPLEPRARALFTGFVLGDDRFQDPVTVEDFRATGLSHLLAVSGQNVAFVLVVLRPVVSRVGLRTRFVVIVAAVSSFALLTRFEPSVLRATAMAAIAALGTTLGRPVAPIRVLALAVTGLVLVDPLLARSLGFALSVAASAGIVVASPPLLARLPGPRTLAELVSVTVAAQAAVAPLLVLLPGGVPLAAFPANLLAVPAAGPLMVWGLTAGPVAGLLGDGAAHLIQVPTNVLLWWIAGVSTRFATLPVGHLGVVHVSVLAAVVSLAVVAWRVRPGCRWPVRVALAVGGLVLVAAVVPVRSPGPRLPLGPGAELWVADAGAALVVVDGRADVGRVLGGLRAAGVRSLDVVVSRTASRSSARVVRVLVERFEPATVIGPTGLALPGAVVAEGELTLSGQGLDVVVRPDGERLDVVVRTDGGQLAAGRPVDRRLVGVGVASPRAPPVARSRAPPAIRAGAGRPGRAVARRPALRRRAPGARHGHPQPDAGLVLRCRLVLGLRRLPAQG